VAGRGGRARFGEVEEGVPGWWEGGEVERLVGICGGREGSGGGSSLMAFVFRSAEGVVLWCCCWAGDGEGGFGGEYWVAASTLCLGGDLAGAIGDLVDVVARRGVEGDCLPNGGGGGGTVWREMCRGDCDADCRCDPLLLERTRHPTAATPDEVEEELEGSVRVGEAVIIAPHGCRGRWLWCSNSGFWARCGGDMSACLWSKLDGNGFAYRDRATPAVVAL